MIETTERTCLNANILDVYNSNKKDRCNKCERLAEYIQMETNEILCWNHSL